jgi:hypothetical protein
LIPDGVKPLLLTLSAILLASATLGSSCDPVHSDAVDSLGDEAPNVRKGPLHRPGQPCTACHDGALGDPPLFTVAGTIFLNANSLEPAVGATVSLTSSDGKVFNATTNAAGNFYTSESEFTPVYPMKVEVTANGVNVKMTSEVGRDASCAKCHSDPAGPTSAGHVYIPADGKTP